MLRIKSKSTTKQKNSIHCNDLYNSNQYLHVESEKQVMRQGKTNRHIFKRI